MDRLTYFVLTFTFFIYCPFHVSAQEFEPITDVILEKPEDYSNYHQDVLHAIEWLQATPINSEKEKRNLVNGFLVQWMSGSPDVKITLRPGMIPFQDQPDHLMAFLAGWIKNSLTNNVTKNDMINAHAATLHVLEFYEKNKPFTGKIRSLEKLKRIKAKNKLEAHIKKML